MAGLPGFASHGSGLYLGAGCQQWKLLDVPGTQPPLSDAVVNFSFVIPHITNARSNALLVYL